MEAIQAVDGSMMVLPMQTGMNALWVRSGAAVDVLRQGSGAIPIGQQWVGRELFHSVVSRLRHRSSGVADRYGKRESYGQAGAGSGSARPLRIAPWRDRERHGRH